jgi:hypothetical protein
MHRINARPRWIVCAHVSRFHRLTVGVPYTAQLGLHTVIKKIKSTKKNKTAGRHIHEDKTTQHWSV